MKRLFLLITVLLSAAAAVCVLPGCAQHTHIVVSSQRFGDFYCSVYEDDTLEIVKYMGEDVIVQVPSGMIDRKVVGISTRAFEGKEGVEEVYLPATITALPAKLFDNCADLRAVYIPASVRSIGKDFITDCPAFTTVLYAGTESQWKAISKGSMLTDNYTLSVAEIRFEYVVNLQNP